MAALADEKNCSILMGHDEKQEGNQTMLKKMYEESTEKRKIALARTIVLLLNGVNCDMLVVPVIRFAVSDDDHMIKKLLLIYWELVEKKSKDGNDVSEFTLICNNLINDLTSPNEYIRGCTLRVLRTLSHVREVMENMVDVVVQNLKHGNAYVRRNAVLAAHAMYKSFPDLLHDGPELVEALLEDEDTQVVVNSLRMLADTAEPVAFRYLARQSSNVKSFATPLQLVTIDVVKKACNMPNAARQKGKWLRILFELIDSTNSGSVLLAGADTLVELSRSAAAVRAAMQCYSRLLTMYSDYNVRLVILTRISALQRTHSEILREFAMDILACFASKSDGIRQKTLDIVMDLLSPSNAGEVSAFLARQVDSEDPSGVKKFGVMVRSLHDRLGELPEIGKPILQPMFTLMSRDAHDVAADAAVVVREIAEREAELRPQILDKLAEIFPVCGGSRVYRIAAWILAEYATEPAQIQEALEVILGEIQGALGKDEDEAGAEGSAARSAAGPSVRVLADGTYAPTAAEPARAEIDEKSSGLKALLDWDWHVHSSLANCLTKLSLRLLTSRNDDFAAKMRVDVLMVMCKLLNRADKVEDRRQSIDDCSKRRILMCMQVLAQPNSSVAAVWLKESREGFQEYLSFARSSSAAKAAQEVVPPERAVMFRQMISKRSRIDLEEDGVGAGAVEQRRHALMALTGYADPIFAEAELIIEGSNVILDTVLINRTKETYTNVNLDLEMSAGLATTDRYEPTNIGPYGVKSLRKHIKVSSTEASSIQGTLVFDQKADKGQIFTRPISLDAAEFIRSRFLSVSEFQQMWAAFEWENRIPVSTTQWSPQEIVRKVAELTSLQVLVMPSDDSGESEFICANLSGRSLFDEDIVCNVSVERPPSDTDEHPVSSGAVRVRTKSQGLALSLGEKISKHFGSQSTNSGDKAE